MEKYKPVFEKKVFDSHMHSSRRHHVDESVMLYKRIMELNNLGKFLLLSMSLHMPDYKFDYDSNLKNAFYKTAMGSDVYSYASVKYYPEKSGEENAKEFLKEAEKCISAGFDGIKMLYGHPQFRKVFGDLTGKLYERLFDFLEENGIPITIHNSDPSSGWDKSKLDAYALEHKRYYDETCPTYGHCQQDALNLMKKHPKLKLTLAHMGFMCEKGQEKNAEEFLGDYEFTKFDTTGGPFLHCENNWDFWEKFFIKYQDKIKFGSDTYNSSPSDYDGWEYDIQYRPYCCRHFFMDKGEYDYAGRSYIGRNLPESITDKIFWQNAVNELGEKSKKIDPKYIEKEIAVLSEVYAGDEWKMYDINYVKNYFENK